MAEVKKISKTGRRSMGDVKTAPKAVAWAWEKGIRVGEGRKPDVYIYNELDIPLFDPNDFIVIRTNTNWVTGGAANPNKR